MNSRYAAVKQLLRDLLLELPASSVDVEKMHANIQQDVQTHRANGKLPTTIQRNSYIMSAVLAHQNIKDVTEKSVLESSKGKVCRLLRNRIIEGPDMTLSTGSRRDGLSTDGCVKKRQNSLLKGLMSASLNWYDDV